MNISSKQFYHYKPSPILEFPTSIYSYMDPSYVRDRQVYLYKLALEEIDENHVLKEDTFSNIKWYSRILEYILRIEELSLKTKSLITLESPYSGFKYLISDYFNNSSAVIETALLPRPEYVCKLLLWSNIEKTRLRYPVSFYHTILFSDFYWSYYFHERIQTPHFFEKMIKYNMEQTPHTPSSILFLKCLDPDVDLAEHVDLLSQDYQIAFQSAVLFGKELPLDMLLFEASLEPQWAYHLLTAFEDIPEDIEGMANSALQYSPPWLIEYLHKKNLFQTEPHKAKTLLKESLEISGHPLSEDIKEGCKKILD